MRGDRAAPHVALLALLPRVAFHPDNAWPPICARLREAAGASAFALWLEPLSVRALTADRLVLEGPEHVQRWARDRFGRLLHEAVHDVLGPEVEVEIVSAATKCTSVAPAQPPPQPLAGPSPQLTFEEFVIGGSNRLAHAAALAVAEMPGQAYNPLFLYGPPGLGKTHLLHSIANYIELFGSGLTVRLTTAEAFVNEFVAALQSKSVEHFKARFRHSDVLLIDDVQFLERKTRTEEEFFHTFNALHETGAQVVLTSDRLPRDLAGLEDRLRARFAAGLVTDMAAPDATTRLTILRKHAARAGLALRDESALDVIAERITDNVRVLEGALVRVIAFASLTGRTVDGGLAAEVLDGLYPAARRVRRSIDEIQAAACEAFGVTQQELVSASRTARVVWPRQVAMYLARELTDQTLPAIGRAFGDRDHSTVLHAHRRTTKRIGADPEAFEAVRELTERLHAPR